MRLSRMALLGIVAWTFLMGLWIGRWDDHRKVVRLLADAPACISALKEKAP